MIYIDIDNFKNINDTLGHSEGNKLLISVANCLKIKLRTKDIVARLSGDEFTCLLPETEQEESKNAFCNVTNMLEREMKTKNWPISFSVGIVSFEKLPFDLIEAIKIADDLMYSVKNNKKNNLAYKIWHGKF